ncbi:MULTISPECIES: transcriptional regulator [unclassified Mesorhizobium]|uniref:transcriptional regulator n=1 Tax=unclassified Mesorhizobium TaxID=325217 RepID=UPI003338B759
MNRGPVKHSRPAGQSFVEKAMVAYGSPLPDWLDELARLADASDLGVAGQRIGYSRSAVSTIISGKYLGDVARVEQMVRGALMAATVECPVLGEIGRDRCLTEQKEPFRATSRHRAQLFHACKTCPQRRK